MSFVKEPLLQGSNFSNEALIHSASERISSVFFLFFSPVLYASCKELRR
jgi:hypothetical protein